LLNTPGIRISAYVNRIGTVSLKKDLHPDLSLIESSPLRCPDVATTTNMLSLIEKMQQKGDTLGGEIICVIQNVPAGWGEPVFDKLQAELGKAMLSINAVKGFDIGSGFEGAKMKGSEHNDLFEEKGGKVATKTNYSGGVQGGISNGEDIYFRVAFKPVATLMQNQPSVDSNGKTITLKGKGRHDVCVIPRAVPIVEAMAALVLADAYLLNRSARL
jgi:chorismate synthase